MRALARCVGALPPPPPRFCCSSASESNAFLLGPSWSALTAPHCPPCTPNHPYRMVNETDIVELELKSKRFNLSVKKKEALKAEQPAMQVIHAPMAMAAAPAAAPAPVAAAPAPAPAAAAPAAAAPKPAAAAAPIAASIPAGVEVFSPMSGTMYRAPAPGEPPFVREGDKVKKGQAVCIVEAMKLMNEIEVRGCLDKERGGRPWLLQLSLLARSCSSGGVRRPPPLSPTSPCKLAPTRAHNCKQQQLQTTTTNNNYKQQSTTDRGRRRGRQDPRRERHARHARHAAHDHQALKSSERQKPPCRQ